MDNPVPMLLNLAAVAAIAIGAVLLIWRTSGRQTAQRATIELGYPPDRFPAHDIVGQDALQALATTQARLLTVYHSLSPSSDLAQRLNTFLHELRGIMDVAYQVAVITRAYGSSAQLTRLVSEVQQIEAQFSQQVVHRLLAYEADTQEELLNHRLTTLRALVRDITPGTETAVPLLNS